MVPWSYIRAWNCYGCGNICCTSATVPLTTAEWLKIIQNFGVGCTEPTVTGFYLKKTRDDCCIFQYKFMGHYLCSIQNMKPHACKLWPFKIYNKPKYGLGREAVFSFKGEVFYIYLDSACEGITYGRPCSHFVDQTIPEFIELSFGSREKQAYSTGNLSVFQIPRISLQQSYYSGW